MIYTVGLVELYEPAIDAGRAIKLGPHTRPDGTPDPGGWVWRTAADARAYLKYRRALDVRRVYGVMADWDTETRDVPGEPTRCLSRNAQVVRVDQPKG